MSSTITPNMGLIVPGVGTEPGPTWAQDLNSSLGVLDQHDHSSGQGVQITPSGLNINNDLAINSNNLTSVKTVNFAAQLASLPGSAPNLGCVYVAGNELYYNDEAGNVVQITNTGSVNAGAGSITGLPSGTASASYNSGSGTFIWQSATSTPANMDFGSAILRNIVANSKGLTLNPPNSMAADYAVQLPSPNGAGGTVFMTYDTSNNIGQGPLLTGGLTSTNITPGGIDVASLSATVTNNLFNNSGPAQFTPLFTDTSSGTLTKGTIATEQCTWSRRGSFMVIHLDINYTSAGSGATGDILLTIPNSQSIDLTSTGTVVNTGSILTLGKGCCGYGGGNFNNSSILLLTPVVYDATHVRIVTFDGASYIYFSSTQWNASNPVGLGLTIEVPISGWASHL